MLFVDRFVGYRRRMARFFHISDVHVFADSPGWTVRDLLSKRATGWVNWRILGRAKRFANARRILTQFAERVLAERPDAVIFSGDAAALGFSSEMSEAAQLLRVNEIPGFSVPGNHDHYTWASVRQRGFETAFRPWLEGIRVTDETYPFARNVNGVWLIGVNSSVPNWGVTDARGLVGPEQLRRLDELLTKLPAGPRVLVTHYPYVTAEGTAEQRLHGLRDREQLAAIVSRHGISTWFCGHRHHHYLFGPNNEVPFQVICAGSTTMIGDAGFREVTIDDKDTANCIRHSFGA
jgi:3',5'-cyclic AMP phosphodiesterase CpdA